VKYLTIVMTIIFVTYGQIIIKYEINKLKGLDIENFRSIAIFLFRCVGNFWILSGLFAAVIAAGAWMLAMSKFELSKAYPMLSINFALVPLLSVLIFGETLNTAKTIGTVLIVAGVVILSIK